MAEESSVHSRGLPSLEIWGGVECSVVRTPRGVCDQLERTGHATRDDDLDRFAALGLRTLRYPVLWDRHATAPVDWSWADRRLARLRRLNLRPIVGLLHHGCGPLPGGFLDPSFVPAFAAFAGAVARRYPWIDAYTPINEPLTTARFSGLYGLWHPFGRDDLTFARVFLIQCRAIRAAMAAIREVNPAAQLIQTEDVGKTHATAPLAYQADWENERRWLTFDLLRGDFGPDYLVWDYLRWIGVDEDALRDFRDSPCPPQVLGMNHYVTGERLLDHDVEKYPPTAVGGNHRQRYADVPAVRARADGAVGPRALLGELCERYAQPCAITEVQLDCSRDEQLRWLKEVWEAAHSIHRQGGPVCAVTAWALVGAWDWDTLLLESRAHYESGAFDASHPPPTLTAIGRAVQQLAQAGDFDHPVLATPGWWRRPSRLLWPPVHAPAGGEGRAESRETANEGPPLLLINGSEVIGRELLAACAQRALRVEIVRTVRDPWNDFEATARGPAPWAAVVVSDPAIPDTVDPGTAEACAQALEARQIPCAVLRSAADASSGDTIRRLLDSLIDRSFDAIMQTVS